MRWQNITLGIIGILFLFLIVSFHEIVLAFFLYGLESIGFRNWDQLTIPLAVLGTLLFVFIMSKIFGKKE